MLQGSLTQLEKSRQSNSSFESVAFAAALFTILAKPSFGQIFLVHAVSMEPFHLTIFFLALHHEPERRTVAVAIGGLGGEEFLL